MPGNLTPAERSLRAKVAAHASWARTEDSSGRTAPARAALDAKFEAMANLDGVTDPAERARRIEHARKQYFGALALKSAIARRKAKELIQAAESELTEAGDPDAA